MLHLTADWKLLSDLGDKLVFPSFIAITRLRPDIVLFSTSIKTVIILELTCPCEENMEEWHQKKFFKYDPLTTSIRYSGWTVYFFAVEVGARGYCSTSLKSCLLHLGLSRKLVQPILKSLSLASLKASFQIWEGRDSKEWIPITMDSAINVYLKNDKQNLMSSKPIHSEKAQPPVDFAINKRSVKTYVNCGLLNKGNTCYVNASLQCLSTMEQLRSNFTFCNDSLSPFTSSFVRIMSLLRSSKSPLDPSQFLRFLQGIVTKSGRET